MSPVQPVIPPSDIVRIEDEWTGSAWPVDPLQHASGAASFRHAVGLTGRQPLSAIFPEPIPLEPSRTLVAYLLIDRCDSAPAAVGVEIQVDGLPLRHYWGEQTLWDEPEDTFARTGRTLPVRLGDVPPAGEWVRLEIPVESHRPQAKIEGLRLLVDSRQSATVWWDHIALTSPRGDRRFARPQPLTLALSP